MELYNTVLEQHIHVMILNTRDKHHHIVRHILLFGITHIAYFVCEQCSPLCLMLIFDFFFVILFGLHLDSVLKLGCMSGSYLTALLSTYEYSNWDQLCPQAIILSPLNAQQGC